MKYLINTFLLFLVLSISTLAANAQNTNSILKASTENVNVENETKGFSARKNQTSTPAKERSGLVISAFLGGAKTLSSDLNVSQPALNTEITFEKVRFSDRSFQSPLYYGFRAGYFFPQAPNIGVESEFIHLKVYSDQQQRVRASGTYRSIPINREIRLGEIVQQYSISHGVNLLLFNIAARRGFGDKDGKNQSRFILAGRGGIGTTIPHTESTIDNQHQEQYEIGRFAWQLGGGGEFKIWRGLYALGEYKFTQTKQRGKIYAGEAESNLRTHHGIFGLSYHF